jgi:Mg/Co/Ni transporter MgtE
MALDLIAFIAGVIYGYMSPGKEDRVKLLKKGLRIGVIVGLVLAVLNLLVGGILSFGATLVGSIIGIGFLTLIFVVGTIVGDWLERKAK